MRVAPTSREEKQSICVVVSRAGSCQAGPGHDSLLGTVHKRPPSRKWGQKPSSYRAIETWHSPAGRRGDHPPGLPWYPPDPGHLRGAGSDRPCPLRGPGPDRPGAAGHRIPIPHRAVHGPPLRSGFGLFHSPDPDHDATGRSRRCGAPAHGPGTGDIPRSTGGHRHRPAPQEPAQQIRQRSSIRRSLPSGCSRRPRNRA